MERKPNTNADDMHAFLRPTTIQGARPTFHSIHNFQLLCCCFSIVLPN